MLALLIRSLPEHLGKAVEGDVVTAEIGRLQRNLELRYGNEVVLGRDEGFAVVKTHLPGLKNKTV